MAVNEQGAADAGAEGQHEDDAPLVPPPTDDQRAHVGLETRAIDVNAAGVVAGDFSRNGSPAAFTWQDGRMTDVSIQSSEWTIVRVLVPARL